MTVPKSVREYKLTYNEFNINEFIWKNLRIGFSLRKCRSIGANIFA